MKERNFQFVFIIGAEGSGTTMLTRILSRLQNVVGLGGNYISIPEEDKEARSLVAEFNKTTAALWDREATHETYQHAKEQLPKVLDHLLGLNNYADVSHIVYKRSAPFLKGDRYRPDASDLFNLFENMRMIVMYRDPKASSFSALRRGFADNLRHCAKICEEQLTYLSAQLATLNPDSYQVISYEEFCSQPEIWAEQLAEFCQLPAEDLLKAIDQENVTKGKNDRWLQELNSSEREFLSDFFDARRSFHWPLLANSFLGD